MVVVRLFLLSFIMIFLACDKGGAFVEGYVFEDQYMLPAKNLRIDITRNFHRNSDFFVAGGISGEDGHFKIYYKRKLGLGYQHNLKVRSNTSSAILLTKELTSRKSENLNLVVDTADTYVKFAVKNHSASLLRIIINNSISENINPLSEKLLKDGIQVKGFGDSFYTWTSTNTASGQFITVTKKISISTKTDTLTEQIDIN